MSIVSSVLLQMSCCEDAFDDEKGSRPGLESINAWLAGWGKAPLAELQEDMCRGKHPQTFVFGGGYNMFPEDDFAELITNMDWEYPESVVLIINPEEGRTRIWRPEFPATS